MPNLSSAIPTPDAPSISRADDLAPVRQRQQTELSHRAYLRAQARGQGDSLSDWLDAERELHSRMPISILDEGERYRIRAGVPGMTAAQVHISASERSLLIAGRREWHRTGLQGARLLADELAAGEVARLLDLPEAIQSDALIASVNHGVVEILAPKAAAWVRKDVTPILVRSAERAPQVAKPAPKPRARATKNAKASTKPRARTKTDSSVD